MYNIIYISTAMQLFDEYELTILLDECREYNGQQGITGMLLYADGTFIQVLEGEKADVMRVFEKIKYDARHNNIIELAGGPLTERNFPQWEMGFASVNSVILQEFEGYINPVNGVFLNDHTRNAAMILLKSFAETNRMN